LAAPIALVCLRLIQGFALGGEFGAAVTLVSEYARPDQRGRWAALPQAGGPAGTIIAAGVLSLLGASLSKASFDAWGRRVAFLIAIPLLLVGAWIRRGVEESPTFVAAALMGVDGSTTPVAIYLALCALISIVAVATGPETRGRDLHRIDGI
jgi:MFS family permease